MSIWSVIITKKLSPPGEALHPINIYHLDNFQNLFTLIIFLILPNTSMKFIEYMIATCLSSVVSCWHAACVHVSQSEKNKDIQALTLVML